MTFMSWQWSVIKEVNDWAHRGTMTSEQAWKLEMKFKMFFHLRIYHSWSPIRISLFSASKSKNSISLPLTLLYAQPFYLFLHHLHILHFQRQTLGLFICWICSCRHFTVLLQGTTKYLFKWSIFTENSSNF